MEEQAKRKDTSTLSLKYASEIYLAKSSTSTLAGSRSPIKPATFIPPPTRTIQPATANEETAKILKVKTLSALFGPKRHHSNSVTRILLHIVAGKLLLTCTFLTLSSFWQSWKNGSVKYC